MSAAWDTRLVDTQPAPPRDHNLWRDNAPLHEALARTPAGWATDSLDGLGGELGGHAAHAAANTLLGELENGVQCPDPQRSARSWRGGFQPDAPRAQPAGWSGGRPLRCALGTAIARGAAARFQAGPIRRMPWTRLIAETMYTAPQIGHHRSPARSMKRVRSSHSWVWQGSR